MRKQVLHPDTKSKCGNVRPHKGLPVPTLSSKGMEKKMEAYVD